MKNHINNHRSTFTSFAYHELAFIVVVISVWRIFLIGIAFFSPMFLPPRLDFIGPNPFANMDGIHYLSIARSSYFQFEHAFFPLYPLTIRYVGNMVHAPYELVGVVLSTLFFGGALCVWYMLLRLRYSTALSRWVIVNISFFPTTVFFGSIYNESMYLFVASLSLYFISTSRWIPAFLIGSLTSATRLFGVFLFPMFYEIIRRQKKLPPAIYILIPCSVFVGVMLYMSYLQMKIGDSLAFFHSQPAFGAGRSGSTLILLPQVIYRYIKIFVTVPYTQMDFWVSIFELTSFGLAIYVLYLGWRKKLLSEGELWYCGSVLIIPTLTGTFSSIPRYILSAFPLFIVPSMLLSKRWKILYATISIIMAACCTALFVQGYFVA